LRAKKTGGSVPTRNIKRSIAGNTRTRGKKREGMSLAEKGPKKSIPGPMAEAVPEGTRKGEGDHFNDSQRK